MPKNSKGCHTSQCYANYIRTIYKLMLCKLWTSKNQILKTILTYFSLKEKAMTRYTRAYIKLNDRVNTKEARRFVLLWSLNKNSRIVAVSSGKKIVIIITILVIVPKLMIITIK